MAETRLWHQAAPPAAASDPRVGMVLSDRYRIDRKIGQGGMGSVFVGEHLLIGRKVAIKCLHPQFADDPDTVKRFHNEARAVSAIGHPNIVEAIDMGQMEDGTSYVVFEYLEGRDLADHLDQIGAPLDIAEAIDIAGQMCDALTAVHRHGIIHRDLKPENVFLVQRDDQPRFIKILDFGISKLGLEAVSAMTAKGTVLGTPQYMSPEQVSGKGLDEGTDLYSLGVVIYSMLSGGRLPFDADSLPALVMKICAETPPPLRRINPDLPTRLVDVVNRLLAKRRADRFASAADVKAALLGALEPRASPLGKGHAWLADTGELGASTASEADLQDTAPPDPSAAPNLANAESLPVRSRWPAVAFMGFAAVLVALLSWWATQRQEPAADTPTDVVETSIEVSPPDAHATLDGKPLTLPAQLAHQRNAPNEILVVEKEGFIPQRHKLRYDRSQQLQVRLEPTHEREPAAQQAPTDPSKTTHTRPRRRRTSTVPVAMIEAADTASAPPTAQTSATPAPADNQNNEPSATPTSSDNRDSQSSPPAAMRELKRIAL